MDNRATLYRVDGTFEYVTPANGSHFTLEEMQGFVGGFIEMVRFPNGTWLIVNEEGRLDNLPVNPGATAQWLAHLPLSRYPENNPGDVVGNALFTTAGWLE